MSRNGAGTMQPLTTGDSSVNGSTTTTMQQLSSIQKNVRLPNRYRFDDSDDPATPSPAKKGQATTGGQDLDDFAKHLSVHRTPEQKQLNRKRSQFFEEVFKGRGLQAARDRVVGESMVLAELRTNVIVGCDYAGRSAKQLTLGATQVHDEYALIASISFTLSQRYQKPESSIGVAITHSTCMLNSGSFAPTYTLYIHALSIHLQPATNKRMAMLLTKELHESLGVPPARGCIIFRPVEEHCLSRSGQTIISEIEETAKGSEADERPGTDAIVSSAKPHGRRKPSMRSLRSRKAVDGGDPEVISEEVESERSDRGQISSSAGAAQIKQRVKQHVVSPASKTGPEVTRRSEDEARPMARRFDKDPAAGRKLSKRKSFMHAVFGV